MTELNESEIRKMPFFVTWHTMFLSILHIDVDLTYMVVFFVMLRVYIYGSLINLNSSFFLLVLFLTFYFIFIFLSLSGNNFNSSIMCHNNKIDVYNIIEFNY
jgi:hypothetical protein